MNRAMIEQADDIPSPESISGPEGEVVAKCEEFTLYANGWLESSPKVERALWRATLGISNRKGLKTDWNSPLPSSNWRNTKPTQRSEHAAHGSTAPELPELK